jgi:aryl-alcohol dehydrogenase-like predicted oxidoreductase
MVHRRLGRTEFTLSPIGFGAFKIGRNQGVKYPLSYQLPGDADVAKLLHGTVELGINYIDTAPAYGISEERIGNWLSKDKVTEVVVSTKVGEAFERGTSKYDFSEAAVRESIARSRNRLGVKRLDIVFIHSDGSDLAILNDTDVVRVLIELRDEGAIAAIGFSGKTVEGAFAVISGGWADAIMVEYHLHDRSHESVITEAGKRGMGVIVKKGLASGRLNPSEAIPFVLSNPNVTSMVIGGLSLDHMRENVRIAASQLA